MIVKETDYIGVLCHPPVVGVDESLYPVYPRYPHPPPVGHQPADTQPANGEQDGEDHQDNHRGVPAVRGCWCGRRLGSCGRVVGSGGSSSGLGCSSCVGGSSGLGGSSC